MVDSFRVEKQKQNYCYSPNNGQFHDIMALGDRVGGPGSATHHSQYYYRVTKIANEDVFQIQKNLNCAII